ncbi:MAG: NAD(+)/NADH kinase [Desulfonatronovibrio sp.]
MKINSVILTTKNRSCEAEALAHEIKTWLKARGVKVCQCAELPERREWEEDESFAADLIIILGGDGTILNQARNMLWLDIPFLGLNLGKVGFMADISRDLWKEQLATVLEQDLQVCKRMVLGYELIRQGALLEKGCAINEVVINRGELARLITLELELPGASKQTIRSDGLIFSTPTGSTAYSVSAGGPLVHPDLEAIIITAICPFLYDFKPLVLPAIQTVTADISKSDADAYLTVDGQSGFKLVAGDRVRVFRNHLDFKVLRCPDTNFASKLVNKGFLRGENN